MAIEDYDFNIISNKRKIYFDRSKKGGIIIIVIIDLKG